MGIRTTPRVPSSLITICTAVTVICLGLVAGQMDWADDDDDPGKFVFLSLQPDPQGLKLCLPLNSDDMTTSSPLDNNIPSRSNILLLLVVAALHVSCFLVDIWQHSKSFRSRSRIYLLIRIQFSGTRPWRHPPARMNVQSSYWLVSNKHACLFGISLLSSSSSSAAGEKFPPPAESIRGHMRVADGGLVRHIRTNSVSNQ